MAAQDHKIVGVWRRVSIQIVFVDVAGIERHGAPSVARESIAHRSRTAHAGFVAKCYELAGDAYGLWLSSNRLLKKSFWA